MLPLRRLLLREFLGLYGVMLVLFVLLVWWGGDRILRAQVDTRMKESLTSLQSDVKGSFEEAERLGRTAARLWQAGSLDPAGAQRALALLRPMLEESKCASAIVLSDTEGRGLIVAKVQGRTDSTTFAPFPDGSRQRYLLRSGEPVRNAPWELMPWMPRERAWYRTGAASPGPCWVEPYRFVVSQWAGVSLAVPARRPDGRLLGVLCVDIPMAGMAAKMHHACPTPSSQVLVSTQSENRLILLGGMEPPEPEMFLRAVGPGFLPHFSRLLAKARAKHATCLSSPVRRDGVTYLGWTVPLDSPRGLDWNLSLLVPESDLLGGARHQATILAAIGTLLVVASVWRIHHLAGRFGSPLSQLAVAAQGLGEGRVPEPVRSGVEEIGTVGEALHRAGEALRAHEELKRTLDHAQRLDTVGTLAGGIAHDVNNQMAVILGQLNLSRQVLEEDHPAARRIHLAEEAALRCSRMVSTLLSFTHHARPELLPVGLNDLVRETVALLERILGGLIRVDLDLEEDLPLIRGDAVQLEQMLTNLAVNARDAMPEGGYLRFRTRNEGSSGILLTVEDTGCGIPPEVLPRIFEPFYTTKDLGKGTGLGLAMVFSIVQGHGGRIEAQSEPGLGTRFHVHFPVARASEPVVPDPTLAASSPAGLAGVRVLVADDEAALREVIADALTEERAQVELAMDGAQAWKLWEGGARYDLVISDQRMPEMTGTELLARVRATGSHVPFILCSGYGLEAMQDLLAEDPRVRTLAKPFALKDLFSLVDELRKPEA